MFLIFFLLKKHKIGYIELVSESEMGFYETDRWDDTFIC